MTHYFNNKKDTAQFESIVKALQDTNCKAMKEMDTNIIKMIAEYGLGYIMHCWYNIGSPNRCDQEIFVMNCHQKVNSSSPGFFSAATITKICDNINDANIFYWYVSSNWSSLPVILCSKHAKLVRFCGFNFCSTISFSDCNQLSQCACGNKMVCNNHDKCQNCNLAPCCWSGGCYKSNRGNRRRRGNCELRNCSKCGKSGCIACIQMVSFQGCNLSNPPSFCGAVYHCNQCLQQMR